MTQQVKDLVLSFLWLWLLLWLGFDPWPGNFFFCGEGGALLQHMEVPRLGVESELQLPAYTTATATPDPSHLCNLRHNSRPCRILNPQREASDGTHLLMDTSHILTP